MVVQNYYGVITYELVIRGSELASCHFTDSLSVHVSPSSRGAP